jgi:hypothetical protein
MEVVQRSEDKMWSAFCDLTEATHTEPPASHLVVHGNWRPEDSFKAVVSNLAEAPNTEPLTSHLERSGDDEGCLETGGQVKGTCGWSYIGNF